MLIGAVESRDILIRHPNAFWKASSKDREMLITSPYTFHRTAHLSFTSEFA